MPGGPVVIRAPRLTFELVLREPGKGGRIYAGWRPGEPPFVGQSAPDLVHAANRLSPGPRHLHVSSFYRLLRGEMRASRSAGFRGLRFPRGDLRELNAFLAGFEEARFVVTEPDCWRFRAA